MSAASAADELLAAWGKIDSSRALHPVDHEVIRSTESARSLVLDLFCASGPQAPQRDLFNACARLGNLMAEAGASPSLAAGVIDSAAQSLSQARVPYDASRVAAATASLVEGYVAAVRDAERVSGLMTWEYPSCVVRLENATAAIACGHPTEDGDALAAWAGRVASRLSKDRVRRAILSGSEPAKTEIASALELVGIDVVLPGASTGQPAAPSEKDTKDSPTASANESEKSRGWLRLPWRK